MQWIPETPGEALLGRDLEKLHGLTFVPGQEQVELICAGEAAAFSFVDDNGWATFIPLTLEGTPLTGFGVRASADCIGKSFVLRSSWALPAWASLALAALRAGSGLRALRSA